MTTDPGPSAADPLGDLPPDAELPPDPRSDPTWRRPGPPSRRGSEPRPRRRPGPPRRPTAPPLLDPILAAWEHLYRRRHQIRPIRPNGVLGLELRRHRGRPVALADGSVVRPGDLVGVVHLVNERVRQLAADGWQTAGWREGRADLAALAAWARHRPPDARPVAYTATTVLLPLAVRAGFEVHPRPRTWWARLEDWHYRSLLRRWNPKGTERLRHGHGRLRSADIWLSAAGLEARYGERDPGSASGPIY